MKRIGIWLGAVALVGVGLFACARLLESSQNPDSPPPNRVAVVHGHIESRREVASGVKPADTVAGPNLETTAVSRLPSLHAAMRDPNPYAAFMAMANAHQRGSFVQAWFLTGICHDALTAGVFAELAARGHADRQPVPLSVERQKALNEVKSRCSALPGSRWAYEPQPNDTNGLLFKSAVTQLNPRGPFQEREWRILADQGALGLVNLYLLAGPDSAPRYFEGERVPDDSESQTIYNDALTLASVYDLVGEGGSQPSLGELFGCLEIQRCDSKHPEDYILAHWPAEAPQRAKIMALYPRVLAAITRGDAMAFAPPRQGGSGISKP